MKKNHSTLENILKLLGCLVIASLAIRIVFALLGGLFYVAFKFGIPLLIAIGLVSWLTNRQKNKFRDY